MNVTATYRKVLNWYSGLPLWKKILYSVVLVGIFILGILYVVSNFLGGRLPTPSTTDAAHTKVVNGVVQDTEKHLAQIEADLAVKKDLAAKLAKKRITDSAVQAEVRSAIKNATSFDEVDVILRGIK